MNEVMAETRSIIVERGLPYPPEKIWRALTQPHLIAEWLMKNDFSPETGHRFSLTADWGAVECQVQTVEPNRSLSYSWDTKDLRSVVTWTLTRTGEGTTLRMEQRGFRPEQRSYFQGATVGWPRFLQQMERVLANLE
ncbi:SRPBCC family protein [Microvirga puerhi]|uniref:SRPBCC domain-containing protein n=1 Tax=Microvirga puerhi TaxID=2876078 RepID=A0ABS7VLA5_9HYPH|nr:SRPBCC domain-containing protein [Microvirga puerhi]MBZ6076322.1 SRPBCC domain-containing protein [Microvirga puerhi]